MKSLFEQLGGTYHEENGQLVPDLALPAEKEKPIGIYGQRHLQYLKEHHKGIYLTLLTSGKLNAYLGDIEEQARDMFFSAGKRICRQAGCDGRAKSRKSDAMGLQNECYP